MHKYFAVFYLIFRASEARLPDLKLLSIGDLDLRYSFILGVFYITIFMMDLLREISLKFWLSLFLIYIGITVLFNTRVMSLLPLYSQLLIDVFIGLIFIRKIGNLHLVLKLVYVLGTMTMVLNYVFLEQIDFLETLRNHNTGAVRVFGLFGDSFPFFLVLLGINFFKENKYWFFIAVSISFFIESFGATALGLVYLMFSYLQIRSSNRLGSFIFLNITYILILELFAGLYYGSKSHSLSLRLDTIEFALRQLDFNNLLYAGYGMFSFIEKPLGIFGNVTNQFVQWIFELGLLGLILALLVFSEALNKGSRRMSSWVFLGLLTFTWFLPGYFIITLIMLIYEKKSCSFHNDN